MVAVNLTSVLKHDQNIIKQKKNFWPIGFEYLLAHHIFSDIIFALGGKG